MCDEVILGNVGMLKLIPDFCKNHKIYDKAVDNYAQALGFFLDCCKTQKICNKNVDTYSSAIKFVPD